MCTAEVQPILCKDSANRMQCIKCYLNAMLRCSLSYAKIVQPNAAHQVLLECNAEVQPILCKGTHVHGIILYLFFGRHYLYGRLFYLVLLPLSVESDPVCAIIMSFRMKHIRLTFDFIPGMVPSSAHIQIEGVCHLISFQRLHKEFVSHHFIRLDDAQFPVLLTQSSVDVFLVCHLGAHTSS